MANPVLSEHQIISGVQQAAATKPLQNQAACLQEQFTGQLPLQRERSMTEILAERLAEAGPDSPSPLFIP